MALDREPLATYDQAIKRLVFLKVSEKHTDQQLELAVQVVADVFWYSDAKVRSDVEKASRLIDQAAAPRRRRAVGASGVWGH